MTPCTDFRTALSELADGSLAGDARTRLEAHLETCAACRTVLADLRHIRQAARSLPKAVPPDDLWQKVRARVDADAGKSKVVAIGSKRPSWRATVTARRTWALAAAALLFLALSAVTFLATRTWLSSPGQSAGVQPSARQPAAPATASAHAGSADLVQSVEMELQQADQHYEKAIAGLEQVTKEGQGSLDPTTAAVLQKNLGILDQAIRESRAALKSQPTSDMARTSLFEALRRKVELLQDTIALINEMRKGNQAGAAQIVGGTKG